MFLPLSGNKKSTVTANEKEKDGKKREYRSAAHSRRLIRDAYAALMQEKPVDKISVSDIVRLADLNRGTFYAHYANPQAVLVEISDEIVSTMQNFLVDFNFSHFLQNPLPLLSKVEELLTANFDFYRKINLPAVFADFTDKIKNILIERIASDTSLPKTVRNSPEFRVALELFAGGLISVYLSFVQGKIKADSTQITGALNMLIRHAFVQFF